MFTVTAFSELMRQAPGLWAPILAAVSLILFAVLRAWTAWLKHRDSDYVRAQNELTIKRLEEEAHEHELKYRHEERMFELETARYQIFLESEFKRLRSEDTPRTIEREIPLKHSPERPQITAPRTAAA